MEKHLEAKNVGHRLAEINTCKLKKTDSFANDGYILIYEGIAAGVDSTMQAVINAAKQVNVGYVRSQA